MPFTWFSQKNQSAAITLDSPKGDEKTRGGEADNCMYSHMHMHDYPQHTLACFNCSGLWMAAESWPNSTCTRSSSFWCPLTFSSLLEAGKMIENKWMQYVFDSDLHLQNLLSSWHIKIQTLRSNSAPLHLFFYLLFVKLKINWRFANCDWTHSHPASSACTYFAVLCTANFLQCSKTNLYYLINRLCGAVYVPTTVFILGHHHRGHAR